MADVQNLLTDGRVRAAAEELVEKKVAKSAQSGVAGENRVLGTPDQRNWPNVPK